MKRLLSVAGALALALLAGGTRAEQADQRPLVAAGQPTVNVGTVAKGRDILTVPVRHGITGVLKEDLVVQNWTKRTLAAGQRLYGIPMTGQVHWSRKPESFIVWCAPRPVPGKTGRRALETFCITPFGLSGFAVVESYSPLMDSRLAMNHPVYVRDPVIEVAPVDIGYPMTAAYRFVSWRRDRATLRVHIRSEFGESVAGEIEVPRLGDGAALAQILGGVVAILPGEKGAVEVRELTPLTSEGDLGL